MKRIINIFALAIVAMQLNAQSTYNVTPLFSPDLVGTARFVGMGGAMSALGGDISTISSNPAGIGIYRSNDFAATASLNVLNTKADFLGSSQDKNNVNFSFDNIGIVFSGNVGGKSLKYVNFGMNYTHRNNFRKKFAMNGWYADEDYSQQYQIQNLYDQSLPDLANISSDSYWDPHYAWLPLLAADAGLIDNNGNINYLPTDATFFSKDKGGVDQIDFNISCNIDDRLYLGATLGIQYVDYQRSSIYSEYDELGEIYTLENWQKTEGSGFDVKLGAIFRPFEYSPFRLGLAFHTPTFYNLTDYSNAYIFGPGGDMATNWYDAYGEDYIVDYTVSSPWRMNISAGYTFGNFLAFNAEYELVDYSSTNMEYADGVGMPTMEEEFECNMQTQHILRLGTEMRLDDNFSMRFGYNYISSAFKEGAWKYISPSSATTATDYTNTKDTNLFTVGLGYKGEGFYFDAAYQCLMQDTDFYTYKDPEISLPATKVSNFQNKVVLTFGMRF